MQLYLVGNKDALFAKKLVPGYVKILSVKYRVHFKAGFGIAHGVGYITKVFCREYNFLRNVFYGKYPGDL